MHKIIVGSIFLAGLISCNNSKESSFTFKQIDVKYPVTRQDTSVKDNYFGTTVADPYRWLENDTSTRNNCLGKSRMR